jgi:hypothetical protein
MQEQLEQLVMQELVQMLEQMELRLLQPWQDRQEQPVMQVQRVMPELVQPMEQMELHQLQPWQVVLVDLERILLRATPTWQIVHSLHHIQ